MILPPLIPPAGGKMDFYVPSPFGRGKIEKPLILLAGGRRFCMSPRPLGEG
ncbi:MAG: hypothetical protein KAH84_03495 [Thiomargarita sp.]|nr:hypothetical protein [Thiomargarita sp.]